MTNNVDPIACPQCGRKIRWQPRLAGQLVRCLCGQKVQVPDVLVVTAPAHAHASTPPRRADAEDPELAEQPPAAPPPAVPLRLPLTTSDRSPVQRALEEREDEVQPSKLVEYYMPLGMGIAGVVINYLFWLKFADTASRALLGGTVVLFMQLILFVPVSLGAAIITSKTLGAAYGPLVPALIKIVAITLGPGAVADGLIYAMFHQEFDYEYVLVGFVIHMFLCGIPLAIMFRLAVAEMAMLVTLMVAPRLTLVFGLAAFWPGLFGEVHR